MSTAAPIQSTSASYTTFRPIITGRYYPIHPTSTTSSSIRRSTFNDSTTPAIVVPLVLGILGLLVRYIAWRHKQSTIAAEQPPPPPAPWNEPPVYSPLPRADRPNALEQRVDEHGQRNAPTSAPPLLTTAPPANTSLSDTISRSVSGQRQSGLRGHHSAQDSHLMRNPSMHSGGQPTLDVESQPKHLPGGNRRVSITVPDVPRQKGEIVLEWSSQQTNPEIQRAGTSDGHVQNPPQNTPEIDTLRQRVQRLEAALEGHTQTFTDIGGPDRPPPAYDVITIAASAGGAAHAQSGLEGNRGT